MKRFIKFIARLLLSTTSLILSPLFALIAKTGYGSNICLRFGFLPLPVHYYSPVPDISRLKEKRHWSKKYDMAGINIDLGKQIELVQSLGEKYSRECVWPEHLESGRTGYYSDNPSFGLASSCLLYSFIRMIKPSKVIEVGAGFSTLVISQALRRNYEEADKESELISIDPYPSDFVLRNISRPCRLVQQHVEDISIVEFESLRAGDILFIDSSHVIRIGGDVNYLYLLILPRLRPGVIVHVHDIYLPYEYPEQFYRREKKFLWTEQYLLHAFLIFNREYEILLSAYLLQLEHPEVFVSAFPQFDPFRHRPSTSFYIRRI